MSLSISLSPRRIAIVLALIALYLALQSIGGKHLEDRLGTEHPHVLSQMVRVFNINRESSIPTWFSASLLLLSSMILAAIAYGKRANHERYNRHWVGLALIFLWLSIDEAVAIHERLTIPLQDTFGTTGPFFFAWVLVGIPLVILFALAYFNFLVHLPHRIRYLFLLAGGCYISGVLGIELIGANKWYMDSGTSLGYSTIGTVEELIEMLGVITFIYALTSYIAEHTTGIQITFSNGEK